MQRLAMHAASSVPPHASVSLTREREETAPHPPAADVPSASSQTAAPERNAIGLVPTTHAESFPPAAPVRLRIPAIGLDTAVETVGLTPDGKKPGVPTSPYRAGWFSGSRKPGEKGTSVMDGVLDTAGGPAVFWRLRDLRTGDAIVVTDAEGRERTFLVTVAESYHVKDAPIRRIYRGDPSVAGLHLITCDGTWDTGIGHYDRRLVVYATMQ